MSIKQRLGVNNIDLSEILSDIDNLPPAGTEDIQSELNAQTEAVNTLMSMVNRKVAEQNGEGEYVWKKMTAQDGDFIDYVVSSDAEAYPDGAEYTDGYWYELVEEGSNFGTKVWNQYASYTSARSGTVSFKAYSYNENTGSVQIQVVPSGNITLADITINDLVGKKILSVLDTSLSTRDSVTVYSTTKLKYADVSFDYSYNTSNGIISLTTSGWYAKCFGKNTTYQSFSKTVSAIIGEHLGYVVDNDSSAYPNGGTDDEGRYYTLLAQV